MRRWQLILAIVGVWLLSTGAYFIHQSSLPRMDVILTAGDCRTPTTILDPPPGVQPLGAVVMVHGLAANRRTMEYLGMDFAGHGFRAYLIDLPGHGDSRQAFSFARAEKCTEAVVSSLLATKQIDPWKTVLLGHSMGGAIVIRIADRDPVAATIALAPAPMNTPTRMPANLLVFSGQYDFWVLKREAQALAAAAGGERIATNDFIQQRAFQLIEVPRASHTTPLVDHNVAHQAEEWAARALFPAIDPKTLALNLDLATYDTYNRGRKRLAGAFMGLFGLILLFPACCAALTAKARAIGPEPSAARPSRSLAWAEVAVCGLAAVLMLKVYLPLRFLRLYSGDYLASIMLLAGAMLLLLNWKYAKDELRSNEGKQIVVAIILGFVSFLACSAWLNWQIADLWLNSPRWLRFLALLPVTWLFSFAEEVALGPVDFGRRRTLRFFVSLLMRFELWLACVFAYFALFSGQALIVILVISFAAFSVLQRLATDALRLRTGSATAAASFGAILAAWLIAAVFPLT